MTGMLFRFWLQRAALVFIVAAILLGIAEYLQRGSLAGLASVLIWSAVAALVAASLTTYWSYKRACGLPRQRLRSSDPDVEPGAADHPLPKNG